MGYRVKTVAELTGIPRNTLLAWERRYGLVHPDRQSNGYREYDDQDVAMLRALKAAVDAGRSPSEAISLLRSRPAALPSAPPPTVEGAGLGPARAAITEALLRFDRREADRAYEEVAELPYPTLIRGLLFPVLREVGERWASGAITVAHEHYASAWCRDRLSAMLLQLRGGPVDGPVALCTTFPGDRHELGLLGLAVLLARGGHRVVWLGADVPLADLCVAALEQAPSLICVSVTLPPAPEALIGFARQLRRTAPAGARVVIGGSGVDPASLPALPGVRWVATLEELAPAQDRVW